jgi:hypothetical protein
MADLGTALDALDRLVAVAAEAAGGESVAEAAEVARRVRRRRGFLGETFVVALAGGTGSGKTSILNAVAGTDVGPVGARRPTTARPLALLPANPEPGLVRLLDDLEIRDRAGQDALPWLAIVDLPDTDSLVAEHRATVERLLPQVDAVVWVVDPEKYQDRTLHDRYLGPLAGYADHFVFVLNQVDRLDPGDVDTVLEDFAASLRRDGLGTPPIVATAADPSLGDAEGIEALVERLRELHDAKRALEHKLLLDIRRAGDLVLERVGGAPTGFDRAWRHALEDAVELLVDDALGSAVPSARRVGRWLGRRRVGIFGRAGPDPTVSPEPSVSAAAVARAGAVLEPVVRSASDAAGPARRELRSLAAETAGLVARGCDAVLASWEIPLPDPPGWWRALRGLRRLAVAVAAVAVAWLAVAIGGDTSPVPAILTLALSVVALVGGRVDAASAGAAWAVGGIHRREDRLADALRRELDRTIGRPARDLLRRRAAVGAAHAELRLVTAPDDL